MKIQINGNDLQEMLKVSKAMELRKMEYEFQKGLLIKNDVLIMNNLDTQLEYRGFNVYEPGEVLILEPTLKVLEHFKTGSLFIENDINGFCNITNYSDKKLRFMPGEVDSYDYLDNDVDEFLFEIKERELKELLEVSYAAANDETRPMLQGINIVGNKFFTCNGFYLSVREGEFNCREHINISRYTWKILLKLTKKTDDLVKVYKNNNLVKFEFKKFTVKGKLYDNFNNIEQIIPTEFQTEFNINAKDLMESLKIMDKLTNEYQVVRLIVNNKLEIITETDMNTMIDKIEPYENTGEYMEIGFNIKYLMAVLKNYKDDVRIKLVTPTSPIIITPTNNNNDLDLLLPVKL